MFSIQRSEIAHNAENLKSCQLHGNCGYKNEEPDYYQQ